MPPIRAPRTRRPGDTATTGERQGSQAGIPAMAHALMENRHGPAGGLPDLRQATGTAERRYSTGAGGPSQGAGLSSQNVVRRQRLRHCSDCVAALRQRGLTRLHVATERQWPVQPPLMVRFGSPLATQGTQSVERIRKRMPEEIFGLDENSGCPIPKDAVSGAWTGPDWRVPGSYGLQSGPHGEAIADGWPRKRRKPRRHDPTMRLTHARCPRRAGSGSVKGQKSRSIGPIPPRQDAMIHCRPEP